ncbi:MAG: 3-oxoacyl-ACP reductase FabG [Eubacteriales bacterium]
MKSGKTVLITGASGGIGSAAALLFAREDYRVVLHYYNSRKKCEILLQQIREMGSEGMITRADVSDDVQVKAMFEEIMAVFGGVDVLVNNAGIAQQKLFTDITADEWNRMFAVNVSGVANCCRVAVPHMISLKEGKIINISSVWGICGASCEVHYSASKAAVIGLTRALAKELGPSGIQVNCVAPGVIATDMVSHLDRDALDALREQTALGTIGQPEDVAESILFLASKKANFITGQVISPNGGFLI